MICLTDKLIAWLYIGLNWIYQPSYARLANQANIKYAEKQQHSYVALIGASDLLKAIPRLIVS